MLKFDIFGIPVTVDPWFWATSFFLGGGIHGLQTGNMTPVFTWMVIIFISILVHELGHALVGRKLGGGVCWIRLWALGGLAHQQGARFDKISRAKMITAGPAAGLALYVLVCLVAIAIWPENNVGLDLVLGASTLWIYTPDNYDLLMIFSETPMKIEIFQQFIWINLFWSLINLLPIFPLDGGQLAENFMRSPRKMHLIGVVFAGAIATIGFVFLQSTFMAFLFGFLAYQNYQGYKRANF